MKHMTEETAAAPDNPLRNLGRIIAVASGKGGVGKSTVSANLAVEMARRGLRVGLVDADLYGPSIPGMLGIDATVPPATGSDGRIVPAESHGVRVISMAMLTGDDQPAVLRAPMVTKFLRMFVTQVAWGELDVLLLDLPPGTGDTQLTLAQSFPLVGAIIVSTPQNVSLKIARRGLRMLEQVKVPILGLVENMSGFTCPSCGNVTHIFHQGGGRTEAENLGVPFLGAIPLDPALVEGGDRGVPLVITAPTSPAAKAFATLADILTEGRTWVDGPYAPFDWDLITGAGRPTPTTGGPDSLPQELGYDAAGLTITWANRRQCIDARSLRLACRCAVCREEVTGAPLLDPTRVPLDVTPVRIWSVGNYALGIAFSDGHESGIYTFETLRSMENSEVVDV